MIYFPEDLAWIGLTNSHLEKKAILMDCKIKMKVLLHMCFQARAGHHLIYPFNLLQLGERWISPKNYVNIVYPQPNSTHSLQKFILGKHYMV